jgi:hypothetical protein
VHDANDAVEWSIGFYAGGSPLALEPAAGVVNPVLTKRDVADADASFVADPFMLQVDGDWFMFFEVMNRQSRRGEIGCALGREGKWTYRSIVLQEAFHLSYPCVFAWQGDLYMVPETLGPGAVRLYRAASFPDRWIHVADLVEGAFADPSLVYYRERWWLFACATPRTCDALRLFSANDLLGPWTEHPISPIVEGDPRRARPAGRPLVIGDRVLRFAQDCFPAYGTAIRAFTTLELTEAVYREIPANEGRTVLQAGEGWNSFGMHHVDAHSTPEGRWIACVDGWRRVPRSRV